MQGGSLQSPAFRKFDCYLFGNEARGVPREQLAALNTQSFTIAGNGAIESLNLASAVNMCVYELNRERANLPAHPTPGDAR
jgi:TrmH family RNA methyltransferase